VHNLFTEWVWARDQCINGICAHGASSRVSLEILLDSSIGLFQYLNAIMAICKFVLAAFNSFFHLAVICVQSCLEVDEVINCIFSISGQITCDYVNSIDCLLFESIDTIHIISFSFAGLRVVTHWLRLLLLWWHGL